MNKNTFKTVNLEKGIMNIYDFGSIKLHAYKTNDFIIVKAVDITTWKVSDFIMYNNTGYGVKSFYNTIEVETINGL